MMRKQNGIYIPEQDKAKFWGANFEIREYNKIRPKGKLGIDIGAHVGIWTRRMSRDFEKVIAFEPMTKHIECFNENCKGLDNIEFHKLALSDREGSHIMTTKDNNSGMSTMRNQSELRWRKKQYTEKVETRTLDSFNLPKMDFIKIDVEGWEEQVLDGAIDTILKYRPRIYIEIWKRNYNYFSRVLKSRLGYTIEQVGADNYLCEPIKQNNETTN